MMYQTLRRDLMKVDPTGSLYDNLFSSMVKYVGAIAMLESARTIRHPQLAKYITNGDAKRGNLGIAVSRVNERFSQHHPPINPLPTGRRSIDALVREMVLN